MERVAPSTVEVIAGEVEVGHSLVGDLNAYGAGLTRAEGIRLTAQVFDREVALPRPSSWASSAAGSAP